jgi:hypothetical protein
LLANTYKRFAQIPKEKKEKMKFSMSKAKAVTLIISILLMTFVTLLTVPPVKAGVTTIGGAPEGTSGASVLLPSGVTPDYSVTTYAYLSARPLVIGLGQTLLVNVWVTPGVHVATYLTGYKVTITKPDDTTETITLNSYQGDATSWFEYVVDQLGTWKFDFDFPGGYWPPGVYTSPPGAVMGGSRNATFTKSQYWKPSSTLYTTNVTVQSDMVSGWPAAPLPVGYWERPVHVENREWYVLLGNYPWDGCGEGYPDWPEGTNHFKGNTKYTAFAKASATSHIVWKRLDSIAGMIGPEAGTDALTTGGFGASAPGLIYAGRVYETRTIAINGVPTSCATCYDLRTGELYYAIPTADGGVTPTSINYLWGTGLGGTTGEVEGGTAEVSTVVELLRLSGTTMQKINPLTGAVTSYTGVLSGTKIGEYVISISGGRWINWTTRGTSTNFASRVVENRSANGVSSNSLSGNVDWESGWSGSVGWQSYQAALTGMTITGTNIYTGQKTSATDTLVPYTPSQAIVDHGKIACLCLDGIVGCWDLTTGKRLWTSESVYDVSRGWPWGIWGAYSAASYGGNLILCEYAGVFAFNWTTGKISWVYQDESVPFETPYEGLNPFNTGVSIVDGMIYTYNTEHTQSQPITRGWKLHCINATTGEGVWNITTPMNLGAMADGYTMAAAQDGYMYVFGAGKSATTVTAPDTEVLLGQSLMIKGTVLDQSPAQPNTPCVSQGSMTTQMEYLHMQQPIDGIWHNISMTGVPVSLDTIDPNNNFVHIGDVTTDAHSGTFGFTWKPEIAGQYKITATFTGSISYGSSFATTYATVVEAPAATATPEPEPVPDYTGLLYAIMAAVIVAIVIGIVAIVLMLRKH